MRKCLEGANLDQVKSLHPIQKIVKMQLANSKEDISSKERTNILIGERDSK